MHTAKWPQCPSILDSAGDHQGQWLLATNLWASVASSNASLLSQRHRAGWTQSFA